MEEIKHVISMVYKGDFKAMKGYTKALERRERKQVEERINIWKAVKRVYCG
jgi:hypothetical protein